MTVDDPVSPAAASGLPGDGIRRTNETFTATASDSAGVRSLRVLVDGVARVDDRYECDYRFAAPCAADRSHAFDLAGVTDGRHTVTTIAEDAASNVTRIEQVIDVDGTAPVVDRVPVSGRTVSVLVSDAGSGLASGTIEVRDRTSKPFAALKTTLRGGRLTATVPRSISMSAAGHPHLRRRPRRQRLRRRRDLDEPLHPRRQGPARARSATSARRSATAAT